MTILDRRRSGILLHPTSLPGPHGSGDLGPDAFEFIDWLLRAGQSVWQVLPLNPIGPGNSPYASASAFAGSPLLIALEPLVQRGWLPPIDAAEITGFDPRRVDYGRVGAWRIQKLRQASDAFFKRAGGADRESFSIFCAAQAHWLEDYALFAAIDDAVHAARGVRSWTQWTPELAQRDPQALAAAHAELADDLKFWRFTQWCFDNQWAAVRKAANVRGVQLIGDLPIFVAHHSADCWARPDLYQLDARGEPRFVAGVPPDYFSATGQRWGNPLYDWDAMRADGYAWWIARLQRQLELADLVRLDHFRGFAALWEIPSASPTAAEGHWVPTPGAALFEALRNAVRELPVIAEDLGIITPDVEQLRDRFALPGMRVLQFAFGGDAKHGYLPHNYSAHTVAYTGTHDNDTIDGWWKALSAGERAFAETYFGASREALNWRAIRAVSASVARLAVFQLQDVLGLDSAHRMNVPGEHNCWTWRFDWTMVPADAAIDLARISGAYGRAPFEPPAHA